MQRHLVLALTACVVLSSGCKPRKYSSDSNVLVWNASATWTPAIEAEWQKFVQKIGDARYAQNLADRPADLQKWKTAIGYDPGQCVFLKDCIKNPKVNPYYTPEDQSLTVEADCGDVPAILRSYFSYKKGLPFIYTWSVQGPSAPVGVFPPSRIVNQSGLTSMNSLFLDIRNHQHALFYSTPLESEHSDTYLVKVNRETIKSGTVVLDMRGHLMMISRILPDGTPIVIAGHPGPSSGKPPSYFSAKELTEAMLVQDSRFLSGGFRNWRPYTRNPQRTYDLSPVVGAGKKVTYSPKDDLIFALNKDIPDLDREKTQFQKEYVVAGKKVSFNQWIKSQLCTDCSDKKNPEDTRRMIFSLCTLMQERQDRIKAANADALDKAVHPPLTHNVYDAPQPWEAHSTPGFDARLRSEFVLVAQYIRSTVADMAAKNGAVKFSGSPKDLLAQYQGYLDEAAASSACRVSAAGATGNFTVDLKAVSERLFKLSFDPYHCAELRWGIEGKCDAAQSKYYAEQQRLRNVSDPNGRPAPGKPGEQVDGLPIQYSRGPASPVTAAESSPFEVVRELKTRYP